MPGIYAYDHDYQERVSDVLLRVSSAYSLHFSNCDSRSRARDFDFGLYSVSSDWTSMQWVSKELHQKRGAPTVASGFVRPFPYSRSALRYEVSSYLVGHGYSGKLITQDCRLTGIGGENSNLEMFRPQVP